MPINMAALLSRPMTPAPPDDDPSATGGQQAGMGSLQSLMQQPGGGQGGQGGPAPPSEEQIATMLEHLGRFQREWISLLKIPDIGKKDIKGDIMEMMADTMGEGYVTLAQVMNQLKDLPTTPLGQKQWVQEHLRKAEQATSILLEQSAALNPKTGLEPLTPVPPLKSPRERDHQGMVTGAMKFYDYHNPKKGRR